MESNFKFCGGCCQVRPLSAFYKSSRTKDGLCTQCKACSNERVKRWQKSNREKCNSWVSAWRSSNPDKARVIDSKHRAANPEKISESKKRSYYKHHQKNLRRMAEYKSDHPEKLSNYTRQNVTTLGDSYVAQKLRMPLDSIPKSLLEAKRVQLQLTRILKNGNQ